MTFNPGWDQNAKELPSFMEVRELQRQLKAQGVKLTTAVDETTTGPAHFALTDPDGNAILVDQHRQIAGRRARRWNHNNAPPRNTRSGALLTQELSES